MVSVVIIEKNGDYKVQNIKKCLFNELYKKCGFRNNNNFDKRATWKLTHKSKQLFISVFAKNIGKANTENKFDLPPPVDNELYFGKVLILACKKEHSEENVVNLTADIWDKMYETLMGGFEDIENTSDEEESEEEIPEHLKTKHGYKIDGFVVDDDENENSEDEDYEYNEKLVRGRSLIEINSDMELNKDDELLEEDYLTE